MKRRAKSSVTVRPFPVIEMNAVLFSGTMRVWPNSRTRAGRSVITDARVSDRSAIPLTLSRNSAG